MIIGVLWSICGWYKTDSIVGKNYAKTDEILGTRLAKPLNPPSTHKSKKLSYLTFLFVDIERSKEDDTIWWCSFRTRFRGE